MTRHPHTLLRIACSLWLTALDHGLSPTQVAWLRQRLADRAPFTPRELQRLQVPFLAWATRQGFGDRFAGVFGPAALP
jgi:hypothetical protein